MAFAPRTDVLRFEVWPEPDLIRNNWGLGVQDLDGNGYLDFYANHHGAAFGEIIYDFTSGSPRSVSYEIPGDLHGVSFFDVDQDGDADLLQAVGGERGTASDPSDPSLWNQVLLNTGGALSTTNSVSAFGLEYALGRKRLVSQLNFDGDLGVYVGVLNDRPDDTFPGQVFLRETGGRYVAANPLGPSASGELAIGVHFGTDRFVDVVNLDFINRTLRVYENKGSGFVERVMPTGGTLVGDVATGDYDGDLTTDILWSRAGQREGLFEQDSAGAWVNVGSSTTPAFEKSTRILTPGDFDNDGDLDYAALKSTSAGVEVHLNLNRGDGTFFVGQRYVDAAVPGQGTHMISGDFDRDGALDLIITTAPLVAIDGVYVYLAGQKTTNNWLSIELRGTVSETAGLGARVYVTTADGKVRMLEQDGGAHFHAQDSRDLHFGLGANRTADVRIVWPDGYEQSVTGLAANRHVVLTENREASSGVVRQGTSGADVLDGTGWTDTLSGLGGADTLNGLGGADSLYGGDGADRLNGGDGADFLDAAGGNDIVRGQGGADRIRGGQGADVLIGGLSGDVFEYRATSTSTPSARDVVRGGDGAPAFDAPGALQGDVIDLSVMDANLGVSGNQAFRFGGLATKSAGFVWLATSGTDTVLRANVDADADVEFELRIEDGAVAASAYSAADFLL